MNTNEDAAAATIAAYEALIERALAIVDEAPHWQYVDQPSFARLAITGGQAELIWPRSDGGGYDDPCTIEREAKIFPAALLFVTDEELVAWKAEQNRLNEELDRQIKADHRAAAEADERRALAALKAKYES